MTLTATEFIYTGGLETGIRVGLINYPRFPTDPLELRARTLDLARHLRTELCQHSFSIVMPDETIWDSLRSGGGLKRSLRAPPPIRDDANYDPQSS